MRLNLRLNRQGRSILRTALIFLRLRRKLMRRILVEYTSRRRVAKRDGGYKVTLNSAEPLLKEQTVDLGAGRFVYSGIDRRDLFHGGSLRGTKGYEGYEQFIDSVEKRR